jgi:hypothetical protein
LSMVFVVLSTVLETFSVSNIVLVFWRSDSCRLRDGCFRFENVSCIRVNDSLVVFGSNCSSVLLVASI